jgi:hypothetical protein
MNGYVEQCSACHLPCGVIFVVEEGHNRKRSDCCRAKTMGLSPQQAAVLERQLPQAQRPADD